MIPTTCCRRCLTWMPQVSDGLDMVRGTAAAGEGLASFGQGPASWRGPQQVVG